MDSTSSIPAAARSRVPDGVFALGAGLPFSVGCAMPGSERSSAIPGVAGRRAVSRAATAGPRLRSRAVTSASGQTTRKQYAHTTRVTGFGNAAGPHPAREPA